MVSLCCIDHSQVKSPYYRPPSHSHFIQLIRYPRQTNDSPIMDNLVTEARKYMSSDEGKDMMNKFDSNVSFFLSSPYHLPLDLVSNLCFSSGYLLHADDDLPVSPSNKDKPTNRNRLTSPFKEDRGPTRSPLASRSMVKAATPRTSTLLRTTTRTTTTTTTTTTMIKTTKGMKPRVELDKLGDKDRDRDKG
jgi:hypothetical protein